MPQVVEPLAGKAGGCEDALELMRDVAWIEVPAVPDVLPQLVANDSLLALQAAIADPAIVESTKKAVELGDERWRDLLERYRLVVRRDLGRFDGHEVDTAGDGFFATFERPLRALECALQVRADVGLLGLESRMGLHRGECQVRGEKVTGVAVHAAARVMTHAREGEILVSDAVRESVSDREFTLTDRGAHELKGVPGEWRLYALDVPAT